MKNYDYIIVGAGSAGCTLASRLAEDKTIHVLLLEAGGNNNSLLIRVPMAWHYASQSPRFDWGLYSAPENNTGERELHQARGKLMGGTSSTNGMMYSRGNRNDYDGWAAMGLPGWGYNDVLPYFKRSESNWRGATDFHGGDGPLCVSSNPKEPVVYDTMIATAKNLGFAESDDFHGAECTGFGMADFTSRNGQRESSATAYLAKGRIHNNLTIEKHASATRLLFSQEAGQEKRVVGIEYAQNGQLKTAHAGEVIVASGAFASPQLLLLSGIGDTDELRQLGIEVKHHLPRVGKNLQDHPLVAAGFNAAVKFGFEKMLRYDQLALAAINWWFTGGGPLGKAPLSVQAYLRTQQHNDSRWPDTQLQISHVSFMARPWFPGIVKGAGHQFTAAAMQVRPFGRGQVTLRSKNPLAKPIIELGLFKDERDKQAARDMLRFIRQFFATAPLSDLVASELFPGADVDNEQAIDAYIQQTIQTGMHPTSTCAMGTDESNSVVDGALRVHGISGLRVCDASVMPTIVSGNTNAPTIMIAEKAADIIAGKTPLPAAQLSPE